MSSIFEKLQYHTEKDHSVYAIENLKKINPKLNEDNYLTYAIILQNPNLSEKEVAVYTECMKRAFEKEKQIHEELTKIKSQDNIDNDDLCRE